ncbi:MAG TPA: class I SAM-dependent methyltransferase [Woeseiaceae bacterium]|nr:class I SAM-dependent methyltransferase [Woeseiaceae bacterium]
MSAEERTRWDEKYRSGAYAGRRHPTALLVEYLSPTPGRALDVACGAGRNSLFLAARGWHVEGIDISAVGLAQARERAAGEGLDVGWIEADLDDPDALPPGPYDLVLMVRYVNRSLLPHLLTRLAPGGILLVEQHLETTEDVIGPKSSRFRLRHNELLRNVLAAAGDAGRLVYYREGLVTDPDGRPASLAQLVYEAGGTTA